MRVLAIYQPALTRRFRLVSAAAFASFFQGHKQRIQTSTQKDARRDDCQQVIEALVRKHYEPDTAAPYDTDDRGDDTGFDVVLCRLRGRTFNPTAKKGFVLLPWRWAA